MVVCPFESELEACVASDKRNDEYSKTLNGCQDLQDLSPTKLFLRNCKGNNGVQL